MDVPDEEGAGADIVIVNKVLAELKALKAAGGAKIASAMLSAGFGADALVYAGYTEGELTDAGVTADAYAAAAASAALYREEMPAAEDVADSTGAATDGSKSSLVKIVAPVVVCSLVLFIVANLIFRRRSQSADDHGLNENGLPQRYENPAYDTSSPGDSKGNLGFVSGTAAAAGAAAAGTEPAQPKRKKRSSSFRMAKKDKEGITEGPVGPPEWADPEVPFLTRAKAEEKLVATGMVNGSFLVRQSKSVVKGYVVTSCFDGNVANSQLKNKGGDLFYGARNVGSSLGSALSALQINTKVSSIGGIGPYLLGDRISLPAPPKPASPPASEQATGMAEKQQKKKKKTKATKATMASDAGSTTAGSAEKNEENKKKKKKKKKKTTKKGNAMDAEETSLVTNPLTSATAEMIEMSDSSIDLDTTVVSDAGSLDLDLDAVGGLDDDGDFVC